jgi:uncharacterized membrane protein YgcG
MTERGSVAHAAAYGSGSKDGRNVDVGRKHIVQVGGRDKSGHAEDSGREAKVGDDCKRVTSGESNICVYAYGLDADSGKRARSTVDLLATIQRPSNNVVQIISLAIFDVGSEYGTQHVLCDAEGDAWPLEYPVALLPSHVYLRSTRFVRIEIFSEREVVDTVPPTHLVIKRYSVHTSLGRLEAVPNLFVDVGMHNGFDDNIFDAGSFSSSSSSPSFPSTSSSSSDCGTGVAYLDADYFTLLDVRARSETFLADNASGDGDVYRIYRVPGTFMTFSYRNNVDRRLRSKPEVARIIPNHWTSADFVRHMTRPKPTADIRSITTPAAAAAAGTVNIPSVASETANQSIRAPPPPPLSPPILPCDTPPPPPPPLPPSVSSSSSHLRRRHTGATEEVGKGEGSDDGRERKSRRNSSADVNVGESGDNVGEGDDNNGDDNGDGTKLGLDSSGTPETTGTSGLSLTGLSGLLRSDATATTTPSSTTYNGDAYGRGDDGPVTPVLTKSSERGIAPVSRVFSPHQPVVLALSSQLSSSSSSSSHFFDRKSVAACLPPNLRMTVRAFSGQTQATKLATTTAAATTATALGSIIPSARRVLTLYAASEPSRTLPLLPCDVLHWGDALHAYELRYDGAVDVNVMFPALDPPLFVIRNLSVQYHVRQLLVLLQRKHPLLLGRKNLRVSLSLPPGATISSEVPPLAQSKVTILAQQRSKLPLRTQTPTPRPLFIGESLSTTPTTTTRNATSTPHATLGDEAVSRAPVNTATRTCKRDISLSDLLKLVPMGASPHKHNVNDDDDGGGDGGDEKPKEEKVHREERNDRSTVLYLDVAIVVDRRVLLVSERSDTKRVAPSITSSPLPSFSASAHSFVSPSMLPSSSASFSSSSSPESVPIERDPRYDVAPQLGPMGPVLWRNPASRMGGTGDSSNAGGGGGDGTSGGGGGGGTGDGTGTSVGLGDSGGRFATNDRKGAFADITALERYVPDRNRDDLEGDEKGDGNGRFALHDITALERHVPDRNRNDLEGGRNGEGNGRFALHDITALERHVPNRNRDERDDVGDDRHHHHRSRDGHPLPPKPMFLPGSVTPVRRCPTCPASKTQGCDYIRVLVFFNGIGRQIAMPCQPTASQIINYSLNAFQIDDVNHTFLLYTKSNAHVPLSLDTRVPELTRTNAAYAFVLRRSAHRSETCTWIAIGLITIAITLLLILVLAGLQDDPAFVNGRYNPWRTGRFLHTIDGERQRGAAPDDAGFSFYRGEESQSSGGWDW